MEEAEKASFNGFRKPPLFAELSKEFYLPPLSCIPDQGLLCQKPAPVPHLEESPSTSNNNEPKIESHLNSESMCKCPDCGKQLETDKAMFGHMRIHQQSKRRSESRPDPDSDIDRILSNSWGKTKKRRSKPAIDKNSPEAVAASILMEMSRSNDSYQNKERTVESDPLDEKNYVCEKKEGECSNMSFPSHQALVGHHSSYKRKRENVAIQKQTALEIGEMQGSARRKMKKGCHVCEICGVSYPTGQQLGGHKRAHYKKDPSMISEVPDGQTALDSF